MSGHDLIDEIVNIIHQRPSNIASVDVDDFQMTIRNMLQKKMNGGTVMHNPMLVLRDLIDLSKQVLITEDVFKMYVSEVNDNDFLQFDKGN